MRSIPTNHAFTATTKGLAKTLHSHCSVAPHPNQQNYHQFTAIWDTGSTNSCISKRIVQECGLQPIGPGLINHAGTSDEPDKTFVYLVDILLPNQVEVVGVRTAVTSIQGGDLLIGMDIINMGDFAITHPNGGTQYTFQVPTQADIDFVKRPTAPVQNRAARRAQKQKRRRRKK